MKLTTLQKQALAYFVERGKYSEQPHNYVNSLHKLCDKGLLKPTWKFHKPKESLTDSGNTLYFQL